MAEALHNVENPYTFQRQDTIFKEHKVQIITGTYRTNNLPFYLCNIKFVVLILAFVL
jgi:hypothetical protein